MDAGVNGIERMRDLVSVKFRQYAPVDPVRLAKFVSSQRGAQFLPDGTLKFMTKGLNAQELLDQLHQLLETLTEHEAPSLA